LLLQAQLQAVNATVLQMQMMAASGMMNGNANGGMPGNMMHLVHLFVSDSPGV
jgi:hypothetical protein